MQQRQDQLLHAGCTFTSREENMADNQTSQEWELPPTGKGWPTPEQIREVARRQENPYETVRRLRKAVPFADAETLHRKMR